MNATLHGPLDPTFAAGVEGTEVASYRTYAQAQAAVSKLSEDGLDVSVLTIVGTDLRLVERITGRLTLGKVLLSGALSGMWAGSFIALFLLLWLPSPSTSVFLIGLAMGAAFGMVLQVVPYLLRRSRSDFISSTRVVASRYAIVTTQGVGEFKRLLADSEGNLTLLEQARAQRQARANNGPTAFGSRPDEEPKYGVRLSESERQARSEGAGAGEVRPDGTGADEVRSDAPGPEGPGAEEHRADSATAESVTVQDKTTQE